MNRLNRHKEKVIEPIKQQLVMLRHQKEAMFSQSTDTTNNQNSIHNINHLNTNDIRNKNGNTNHSGYYYNNHQNQNNNILTPGNPVILNTKIVTTNYKKS
eukprot:UN01463